MASPAIRRKSFSFFGVCSMSVDWIPGAGLAAVGFVASWWRASAIMEERLNEMRQKVADFQRSSELAEGAVRNEISGAVEKLNNTAASLQVFAAQQNEVNKMVSLGLESLLKRLEKTDERVWRHDSEIAVLRSGMGGQ